MYLQNLLNVCDFLFLDILRPSFNVTYSIPDHFEMAFNLKSTLLVQQVSRRLLTSAQQALSNPYRSHHPPSNDKDG